MFEKKLMVKSVHYRFYTDNDKDENTSEYRIKVSNNNFIRELDNNNECLYDEIITLATQICKSK